MFSLFAMQVVPLNDAQKANVEKLSTNDDAVVVDEESTAVIQRPPTVQDLAPALRAKLIVLEDYSFMQYRIPVPFFKVF
jgi:hypothetical protein